MAVTPKFTLRFHDERTHELLGVLAARRGVSKNHLAEEMLERELHAAALLLEQDLTETIAALRRYRREDHLEQALEDLREADAATSEPLRTRMTPPAAAFDAFGIADTFSHS